MVGGYISGLKSTAELHARAEGLVSLKDQMQALVMSIAKAVSDGHLLLITTPIPLHQDQEMYFGDLNIEFEKLESTKSVDSAQAAAVTSHKEWLDIKSVDVSVQKNLSNLLSSGKALKEKLEKLETEKTLKVKGALEKCHDQGEPRKSDHQTDLIQIC